MGEILEIGPFRLDPEAGVLTRNAQPMPLGPRAVSVLKTLIDHANEYVPKARIMEAVWGDVVVEEVNLAVHINAIRRVLGVESIETLPRRGYRFVGAVREISATPAPRVASNLPTPMTSFIGRERELAEIERLLREDRLVTIVGSAGIGKTRLALKAAAKALGAYRDGIWFVDLAPLREADAVASAVAQTLGVQQTAATRPVVAIAQHLKRRRCLVILDNCEHLLDACAKIASTLLHEAPGLGILATSRESLHVEGEHIIGLASLSLPHEASMSDREASSEAVRLFVDRVRHQLTGFELTPGKSPCVSQICIRLDGIPLALELAAARARSLSIEDINARLGDRFRLLTSDSSLALPRHRTLRTALDWSYDLLVEDERTALARLSIFPGSFTLDAARAVASDASVDEFAVIDILSQLVARSLVDADTRMAGTRYRLLETTRVYAAERLAEMQEVGICRRAHARFFASLFEPALDDWLRKSDAYFHARYGLEIAHVRAALDWAFGPDGDAGLGIALAGNSGPLWYSLGLFGEGELRTELAIERIDASTPRVDVARLWLSLGRLCDETPRKAKPAFEHAVAIFRELRDETGLALSLCRLGRVLSSLGEFAASEATLDEARPLVECKGPELQSVYAFNMARLKSISGDPVAARAHYERSLALDRALGRDSDAMGTLGNLANVAWALGDCDAAERSFRELLDLIRRSPYANNRLLGWTLASLASVMIERGNQEQALEFAREGLPLLEQDATAWRFMDAFALRAAQRGRHRDAVRLMAYANAARVAAEAAPHPIDVRHRERIQALLHGKLDSEELQSLDAEGAKLTEAQACTIALQA